MKKDGKILVLQGKQTLNVTFIESDSLEHTLHSRNRKILRQVAALYIMDAGFLNLCRFF